MNTFQHVDHSVARLERFAATPFGCFPDGERGNTDTSSDDVRRDPTGCSDIVAAAKDGGTLKNVFKVANRILLTP